MLTGFQLQSLQQQESGDQKYQQPKVSGNITARSTSLKPVAIVKPLIIANKVKCHEMQINAPTTMSHKLYSADCEPCNQSDQVQGNESSNETQNHVTLALKLRQYHQDFFLYIET